MPRRQAPTLELRTLHSRKEDGPSNTVRVAPALTPPSADDLAQSLVTEGRAHKGRYLPSGFFRFGNRQQNETVYSVGCFDERRVHTRGAHASRDLSGVIE